MATETMEIVFNEKTGKFVVHFRGVATHAKEHELLDDLRAQLEAQGFEVDETHYHDDPKLPETDPAGETADPLRNGRR